jgi:hypothetical protein
VFYVSQFLHPSLFGHALGQEATSPRCTRSGEKAKFTVFLKALRANGVLILSGNGDVRNAVVAGRALMVLKDTDDDSGALRR